MHKISRPVRGLLAAALAVAATPALAQQGTFSQTVFFGDSLSDAGFFTPLLVQQDPQAAVLGRFTTNPGLVWSEYLADFYGTGAAPAWTATGAAPQPGTGSNYAVGGARVGQDEVGALGYTPSLATQVGAYLAATGGAADPNALYTVWGGANDIFAAVQAPEQAQQMIGAAVTAQVGLVGALKAAGAQYVLVPTVPNIGATPRFLAGGPVAQAGGTALSQAYNQALFAGLAGQGLSVIPLDTYSLLNEVIADPAAYGFANVTGTACQPQITAQSLTCNPNTYVSPGAPDTYLFADGVHPTSRTHALVAQAATAMIEAPRQVGALPHVASSVGRARADMVNAHASRGEDGDATRWWVDGRYDGQRYGPDGSADLYDGGGGTLTVGVDWARGNLVYGAFGGWGHQIMDWGLRRGDFRQDDASIGGYLGWSNDRAWVRGQLSYTQLDYELNRKVRLGPATRAYDSDTDGDNVSAGVSAGWTFGDGAFRHGPVVGLLSQRISIDGFEEERPGESTSLAFGKQDVDSLVGSAGWQAVFNAGGTFEPFVRLTWDREFENDANQVAARAQSIAGSLPYVVPGVEFDDSYGTFTYGSVTRLGGMELIGGSALTIGHQDGSDASFFLSVRGQF